MKKMNRCSIVLIAIICIGISACVALAEDNAAKGGTIRGEVIEATKDLNPIEGVTVKIVSSDGKEWTVKTDAKGKYEFTGLTAGRYTISISKKGYHPRSGKQKIVVPGGEIFDRFKMLKKGDFENRVYQCILQHVAEDIGKRYKLDETIVETLQESILEAFNTVMEQGDQELKDFGPINDYVSAAFIVAMLSKPDFKVTFTKYLTEKQLQDYINYTNARKRNLQKANIQLIIAFVDQKLNLTVSQRENFAKLMLDSPSGKYGVSFIGMLMGVSFRKRVVNLLQNELKIPMDTILNQTQYRIWQILVDMQDDHKELLAIEFSEVPSENTTEKDWTNESPYNSQTWILAEAILKSHIEQLGTFNEKASKRLEIVIKGVSQQYIELELPDFDDNSEFLSKIGFFAQKFMLQNISHEQALENLESLKKELWGESDKNEQWKATELNMITSHPLFQQAIKDVLSENAYFLYKARQTEREKFRANTLQNFLVAYWDIIFLFNDLQLNKLKRITTHLTLPSLSNEGLQVMFLEYLIWMDDQILNPWQKSALKGGR